MLTEGNMLDVDALPDAMVHAVSAPESDDELASPLAEQERRMVEEALRLSGGNQSEAARRLNIGRDALRYKMKRHKLT